MPSWKIGYARVSTGDQSLELQVNALKGMDCQKVFTDIASGGKKNRPGLAEALNFLRKDDTLCVWKLDRLGRSVKNLIEISELLNNRGIQLFSMTDGINTSTSMGRFFFHVMAALAEMERELIRERTRAGLRAARERGVVLGRRTVFSTEKLDQATFLLKNGIKISEIAKQLGISEPTLYRFFPGGSKWKPNP